MKKIILLSCLLLLLCALLVACDRESALPLPEGAVDATAHGVSVENTGEQNSKNLQALIDTLSREGGTVYIPAGRYVFAENGTQTIGAHCIKMRSNVRIVGAGESTVLAPVGESAYGLDMFYFNEYLDTGEAVYLENCRFESFTIDAAGTSLKTYTSAGKGFMFNLFRNCHWRRVTVKNTDATGFGVDCPLDSSMMECTAIGCGKAARDDSGGASGFGIGFGYADGEHIEISGCHARDNRKFGFFFEHQGRFNAEKYAAYAQHDFAVSDCTAAGNLYNFGGIRAMNVTYTDCRSRAARQYGFYFENATDAGALRCFSAGEGAASFAVVQSHAQRVADVFFEQCAAIAAPCGVWLASDGTAALTDSRIRECSFFAMGTYTVYTAGAVQRVTLACNTSNLGTNAFSRETDLLANEKNSWN